MSLLSVLAGANSPPVPAWDMPNAIHMWRGDHLNLTGSNVNSATDQIGSYNIASPATKPVVSALGSKGKRGWASPVGGYLSADGASEAMTSLALFCVLQVPSYTPAPFVYMGGGLASAPASLEIASFHFGAFEAGRKDSGAIADIFFGQSSLVLRDLLYTCSPTVEELYLDGALVASGAFVQGTSNVSRWTMGVNTDLASLLATDVIFGEGRVANQKLVAGDAVNGHNYRLAYWGT